MGKNPLNLTKKIQNSPINTNDNQKNPHAHRSSKKETPTTRRKRTSRKRPRKMENQRGQKMSSPGDMGNEDNETPLHTKIIFMIITLLLIPFLILILIMQWIWRGGRWIPKETEEAK